MSWTGPYNSFNLMELLQPLLVTAVLRNREFIVSVDNQNKAERFEHETFLQYWQANTTQSTAASAKHALYPHALTDNYPIDLTLLISCYNEEEFIEDTLRVVVQALEQTDITYEILVIDDCSKDRSPAIVKQFILTHPNINISLRENIKNKGLAQNYVDGAFIGKGKYYRLICGDNAEPTETIVKVLSFLGQADIIIPYYTSAEGKSCSRLLISKCYTNIINTISGNKIKYYNGLQIHLRNNVMRWHPNTRGFGFQAGLLCLLLSMGFSYKEVSCITIERRGGKGNALTWKNMRSVIHTIISVFLRRVAL